MVESKKSICSFLGMTLQATEKYQNLVRLKYQRAADYTETVTALFVGGDTKEMDVTYLDGFGMILRIIKRLA